MSEPITTPPGFTPGTGAKRPPGPRSLSPLNNASALQRDPIRFALDIWRRYGDVVRSSSVQPASPSPGRTGLALRLARVCGALLTPGTRGGLRRTAIPAALACRRGGGRLSYCAGSLDQCRAPRRGTARPAPAFH